MRRSATTDRPARGPRGGAAAPRAARPRLRRRAAWLVGILVALAAVGVAWYQVHQQMPGWYARLWYPLEHEQTVRQEAGRNGLDPALVAAVIDTESGFVADSRSGQGAVGLMQVQPDTARFIAGLPRRPSPSPDRLAEPEVNIAYGTRFLRYLVDRYGSVDLALVAYNGGPANLGRWLEEAQARGEALRVPDDVPFAETRGFVTKVRDATDIYRRAYGDRLAGAPE
jgi:soluble lytic murein transglycosylase